MLEKIAYCFVCLILFGIIHNVCRTNSSYLPRNKCQKYITIKNDLLSLILIAERPSRGKVVGFHDLNKMSIVGLVSYITYEPIILYLLIINIMHILKLGNINLGSIYNSIAYGAFAIIGFVFVIVIAVDKS